MIPVSPQPSTTQSWQRQLAESFTRIDELLKFLHLSPGDVPVSLRAAEQFSLKVPRYFASLMRKGDPLDPLLLQVLPLHAETLSTPGYLDDPLQESGLLQGNGVLQKYHGRILLITTQSCAVHCRYCFRRHFPYASQQTQRSSWADVLSRLGADQSLSEVILSGGDPLNLSNARLTELIDDIQALPHIRRLRIHTRTPVVLPDRIDAGLTQLLTQTTLSVVMVLHVNHPNEITGRLGEALKPLSSAGVILLNQSVLLKGVNDDLDTQINLSNKLININILPYYIHLLDKVSGAAHFEVDDERPTILKQQLLERLPGYLVPRMVRECPQTSSKSPI